MKRMIYNDILSRIRYALNLTDARLPEVFALGGIARGIEDIRPFFLREGEPGYRECDGTHMGAFLRGIVALKRGAKETGSSGGDALSKNPSNNDVLKALRIALKLKDQDILEILALVNVIVTKPELNALFRNKDHPNFRLCGDQFLRNFLLGLSKKLR
ncbi:MAG: hypothetical protein FD137_1582 [Spirochaetes bacterium]|nr:MAG: hypothetical protein FD137_1582 [Spirochaetota bacterium]